MLKYLENLVGKENFQHIFRDYIIKFTHQSISHLDYISVFEVNVKAIYGEKADDILNQINWDKWIFSPGQVHEKIELSITIISYYKV